MILFKDIPLKLKKHCLTCFQAYQQCKLKNILELWRTLAVARARFLLNNNEVFFYCSILL